MPSLKSHYFYLLVSFASLAFSNMNIFRIYRFIDFIAEISFIEMAHRPCASTRPSCRFYFCSFRRTLCNSNNNCRITNIQCFRDISGWSCETSCSVKTSRFLRSFYSRISTKYAHNSLHEPHHIGTHIKLCSMRIADDDTGSSVRMQY